MTTAALSPAHSSPNRLRVAFVLANFGGGGAQRVLLTLAGAIDRARFAPEIVVLDDAGPWRSLVPGDVAVVNLAARRIRLALWPLARALRRSAPDVAVSTMGALNLALLALRPLIPRKTRLVVREANTPHSHAGSALNRRFYRAAYPRLYRRADRVIVPAAYLGRELRSDFGVPAAKVALLHNPVDEDALRAAALPSSRFAGGGLRFVSVGRLTHQKGIDRLIDAMAQMPSDARLTILGEGPDRSALETRCRVLGLESRIAMPGFAANSASPIAGADALLLPSRWEGMPNVALEALALGTPVIATPEAGAIGDIAARASLGAVTLVAAGAPFAGAMAAVRADPVSSPRASLLPLDFRLNHIATQFERLLAEIAGRSAIAT